MMQVSFSDNQQVLITNNFEELISAEFVGERNAACWQRNLKGDFEEIVNKVEQTGNITVVSEEALLNLELSEQGQLARTIILSDLKLLSECGAAPVLNVLNYYERDEDFPFFPTDVYSFHVDRSPIAGDTFLCTYYGSASEILPNAQAEQKILVPEIRKELHNLYNGQDDGFEDFLKENFFDLHYKAKENAQVINLGNGNLWRLAVDYPESKSLPCIHRAPEEIKGQARLLLIC